MDAGTSYPSQLPPISAVEQHLQPVANADHLIPAVSTDTQPGPASSGARSPQPQDRPLTVTDALGYLDAVKRRFHERPEVYNRFLDIMKDFKKQSIDTPGVIERVSYLFSAHPDLIHGFNIFLPADYHVDGGVGGSVLVTTPSGGHSTVCTVPPPQGQGASALQ